MPSGVKDAIKEAVLRRMAGDEAFVRGQDYYLHGHVLSIVPNGDRLLGLVRDTRNCQVELEVDDGILDYQCDCAAGVEGNFCKHGVAAGLAWLNKSATPKKRRAKRVKLDDAANLLREEDHAVVVGMVVEWASADKELAKKLIAYAAHRTSPEAAAAIVGKQLKEGLRSKGHLDAHHKVHAWLQTAEPAVAALERLLADGQPAAVVRICEAALAELSRVLEKAYDSEDLIVAIEDRIAGLHRDACEQAPPDPDELASALLKLQLNPHLDSFRNAYKVYEGLLGEDGLAVFRILAEAAWATEQREREEQGLNRSGQYGYGYAYRSGAQRVMKSLALDSGDIDRFIEIMGGTISTEQEYGEIVNACREHGLEDSALEWAEKGLRALADRPLPEIRNFVAEQYKKRGRVKEGVQVMWKAYVGSQCSVERYGLLEEYVRPLGEWDRMRLRALDAARKAGLDRMAVTWGSRSYQEKGGREPLVRIYMHEEDIDAAWREATDGGCGRHLLRELAELREKDHPEDVIELYCNLAKESIEGQYGSDYRGAVELLIRAAEAARKANQGARFRAGFAAIQAEHRHKRNLQMLLREHQQALAV